MLEGKEVNLHYSTAHLLKHVIIQEYFMNITHRTNKMATETNLIGNSS